MYSDRGMKSKPQNQGFKEALAYSTRLTILLSDANEWLFHLIFFSGFSIERAGSCSGYSWAIEWEELGGDQQELSVNGSGLYAPFDAQIWTSTILDGGMWLSPVMGDMTRLPKNKPQVIYDC